MTIELAVDLLQTMIFKALVLVAPFLGAAIIIGIGISIIQTVTSIQDQTLTFVPKLLGIGLVAVMVSNWILTSLIEFTTTYFMRIAEMAP